MLSTRPFQRVILMELLITAGLLVLLGVTAGFVIRRELKPLESMATAADEIAKGDLERRVDESDPSTEIGRLGVAFNDMLDGISSLLAERARSETRLRQFVADASHELRTPVAAVRGYTDLYRAGALPDAAAVERAMSRMGFEAKRMGALVDDLLTLIQADAERTLAHDSVDLTELLTGVVDDAAVIDPTRTWRLAVGYGPAIAAGDRLRLHQLFANLLANIRTHTPPGTVATVSVLPGLDEMAVSVSDNGPGVSEEALHRLFDRFYRVDASRSRENGGTGLGLSIVAAIVRSHGGQILASHTPGGGLTMTVVLPRATGTAAIPTRGGPSAGQPGGPVPGAPRRPAGAGRSGPGRRRAGRRGSDRRRHGRPPGRRRQISGSTARARTGFPGDLRHLVTCRKPDVHRLVRVFGRTGDRAASSVQNVSRTASGPYGRPRSCVPLAQHRARGGRHRVPLLSDNLSEQAVGTPPALLVEPDVVRVRLGAARGHT